MKYKGIKENPSPQRHEGAKEKLSLRVPMRIGTKQSRRRLLLISCFMLLAVIPIPGQEKYPPTAEAAFNKPSITIGDNVKYSIIIETENGAKIDFPAIDTLLADLGFTVKDSKREKPKKISRGNFKEEYWWLLTIYTTGSYTIPPVTIKYTMADGTTADPKTKEISLEVRSVIGEGEEPEDIKDIKFPVDIKIGYLKMATWAVLILILIVALVIGIYMYFKYRKIIHPPPPSVPPHIIALRDLEKARAMPLDSPERIKEYYISVSGIIRHYIENRFGFHAPEQTTEEFLEELTITDNLNEIHKGLLADFLKHCDLVKFAKYGPTKEEIDGVYETAKRFIEETKEESSEL